MVDLSCYAIRGTKGRSLDDLDACVEDPTSLTHHDLVVAGDFEARLYVRPSFAQRAPWAGYLASSFPNATFSPVQGPSALVLLRLIKGNERAVFAFPFGAGGRFLLKPESYQRGFGLRVALNLIYPRGDAVNARLRAVDSKRRGPTTTRARVQASEQATFETFDVNRMRDLLSKATGTPADTQLWGRRLTGSDAVTVSVNITFEDLGDFCRRLLKAHRKADYKASFGWIDNVLAIDDPVLIEALRNAVTAQLTSGQLGELQIAPPEVIDWERVTAFRYHFDRRSKDPRLSLTHADLRLADYVAGVSRNSTSIDFGYERLRAGHIYAVNDDGADVHSWTVWNSLVGEIVVKGQTYILDEGSFYSIRRDYLDELNAEIGAIPTCARALPTSTPTEWEDAYNKRAASQVSALLLMDRQTVKYNSSTTPIEICDLLSNDRMLIHVKRHLGSSDLSHLFAQGVVSASALQESPEFRERAQSKVNAVAASMGGFDHFAVDHFRPSDFEIVYAIAERWTGRSLVEALPFFSKINLREAANNLRGRGYRVSLCQIHC